MIKQLHILMLNIFNVLENTDIKYPIILNAEGSYVMDGIHRLLKIYGYPVEHI